MKVGDKILITEFTYPYGKGDIVTIKEFRGDKLLMTQDDCFVHIYDCELIQSDPIVESVINQFKTRSEVGIKKYGTTLERNDLSKLDWLKHLQEEMMDAVLYIEKLKSEL